ncbi:MAG TPA: homoserine dehydrogenase [Acidimicrobiia bacterium]|jgi:homoserine dehydrogenase|nr:homoserine dehydrogenase [Acidimicrobiia bacterium]
MSGNTTVGIGLLGAGTVGGALVRRLVDDHEAIEAKTGLDLAVRRVAVRDPSKPRSFVVPEGVLSDDPHDVVADPAVQLVVEVMGGREPAGDLVLAALELGKPVVTANKELIASRGPELIAAAERAGVPLLFEASVGGGIPIIRPLAETLAGERIERVAGIVNGTTNYILTRMSEGDDYASVLADAQELGYAEPDPTADVSGADAAAKAAILASLAFGTWVGIDVVHYEGIEGLSLTDIEMARFLGYEVKLLAIASRTDAGTSARVYPAMIPISHPLASIRGATNAIFITGPSVDELLFAGPGAGGEPTATAVLGDVIDAAREILAGAEVAPRIRFSPGEIADFGDIVTKWYSRIEVEDRPGVLAQIADAFGKADVSIKSMWQEGEGSSATLLIITHRAPEMQQRKAVDAIRGLDVVRNVAATLRVESDEP